MLNSENGLPVNMLYLGAVEEEREKEEPVEMDCIFEWTFFLLEIEVWSYMKALPAHVTVDHNHTRFDNECSE